MADLIEMLIEILRINCSVVDCYYPNQIEAMFNLFFFPTVFILLIIYLILNYVLDEVRGGLRLLIAIVLYAVIVLNGLMTWFIPLSKFWWLVLILVFGALIFFKRIIFKDQDKAGKGGFGAFAAGGVGGYLAGKMTRSFNDDEKDMKKAINDRLTNLRGIVEQIEKAPAGSDFGAMSSAYWSIKMETEQLIKSYTELGKIPVGGVKIDVEKRGEQFWKSITEISKKYERVAKRYDKGMKKAA